MAVDGSSRGARDSATVLSCVQHGFQRSCGTDPSRARRLRATESPGTHFAACRGAACSVMSGYTSTSPTIGRSAWPRCGSFSRTARSSAASPRRGCTASTSRIAEAILSGSADVLAGACGPELVEGTVVADALSHAGLFTRDDLGRYSRSRAGLRGIRQLRRICELMDPRSESPMETRVRLLLVLSGLPTPESQLVVFDRGGGFVARADLGYPTGRVIVEYDGAFHWEQRRADDRRRDAMRALGWTVLVVSREDYYDSPQQIVATVHAALRRTA
jgi:hypothetical protein